MRQSKLWNRSKVWNRFRLWNRTRLLNRTSQHHNVRDSLIQTLEQSRYVDALCALQGYNPVTIQQHLYDMKRNYSWGIVNE